jgi:hypothetical protein
MENNILGIHYVVALDIDRGNISPANSDNFVQDLNLTTNETATLEIL